MSNVIIIKNIKYLLLQKKGVYLQHEKLKNLIKNAIYLKIVPISSTHDNIL